MANDRPANPPPASERRSNSPPIILLVEDDPVTGEVYRAALTEGGFQVLHVTTGEQAIEFLHRHSAIECVVCDINLQEIDGFDVLRASKELRPHTPVLLVTGLQNPKFPGLAIREGADDMLIKPVDLVELRSRVMALVTRSRERQAARAH